MPTSSRIIFPRSPSLSIVRLAVTLLLLAKLIVSSVQTADIQQLEISNLVRSLTNESVYNKNIRPNFGDSPVTVNITILVNDISSISEINMDFTMDFYFRQYWHDPRLSFAPINNITEISLGGEFAKLIWLPDTFIRNSKSLQMHLSTSSAQTNTLIKVAHTGLILYSTRLTAVANCPMDLRYFPADEQNCKLILASYGYSTKDLIYNWAQGNDSFVLSNLIFLPTFSVKGYNQSKTEETLTTGTFTRLICDIYFVRSLGYYLYQIYVPAFLIVLISWVPFWLDQDDNHARVGLGVTTVLTITTLTTSTIATLPKISYIKAIDVYLFTCFLMVFLSLIEYATVGFFGCKHKVYQVRSGECSAQPHTTTERTGESNQKTDHNQRDANGRKDQLSRLIEIHDTSKIDQYSRVVFPVVFFLFNLIYAFVFLFVI